MASQVFCGFPSLHNSQGPRQIQIPATSFPPSGLEPGGAPWVKDGLPASARNGASSSFFLKTGIFRVLRFLEVFKKDSDRKGFWGGTPRTKALLRGEPAKQAPKKRLDPCKIKIKKSHSLARSLLPQDLHLLLVERHQVLPLRFRKPRKHLQNWAA